MLDKSEKLKTKLRRYIYTFKYKFFTKKVTILKWQFNVFTIFVLGLGVFIGGAGVIPKILALNETNYTISQSGDSNFTLGSTINTTATANNLTLGKDANWLSVNWNYKKPITIKNTSAATLNANTSISITVDTSSLESVLTNCNDIRVTYQNNTELPLTIKRDLSSTGCNDSKNTTLTFPIQTNLTAGSSDSSNYALYYGNTSAVAQGTNGYSIPGGPVATAVCSFDGTTNCQTGQTPASVQGPIKYTTKGALNFDGKNDYVSYSNQNNFSSQVTLSVWFNASNVTSASNTYQNIFSTSTQGGTYLALVKRSPANPFISLNIGGVQRTLEYSLVLVPGQWYYLVATYDGSYIKLYLNGVLRNTSVQYSGALSGFGSGGTQYVGKYYTAGSEFAGQLDEFAIFDRAISQSEITDLYNNGNGKSITPDSSTKVLYHFDENGDDPKNSSKELDVSGNGNTGTISGAKYADGIVPVTQYASHQGVSIEESTTNLVPNPSFESDISTSWNGKNAVNFTSSQLDADGNTLVGSNNIKDVFYYDTTKDSDGGAWRNNVSAQTKSWYTESFSTTRGKKAEFPEKSYIVATDTDISIIDAVENKLWMRILCNSGNEFCYTGSGTYQTVVFALNSRLYIGRNNTVSGSSGLTSINFILDTAQLKQSSGSSDKQQRDGGRTISQRNTWGTTWTNNGPYSGPLINNLVNDVSALVISGKTYIAVATDGGVSLLNETDSTVVNFTSSNVNQNKVVKVQLIGNTMYFAHNDNFSGANRINTLQSIKNISSYSTNQSWSWNFAITTNGAYYNGFGYDQPLSTPNFQISLGNSSIQNMFVTSGTSSADGTSNTIYIGTLGGLVVLQENQTDSTKGSVKYYDKNHITEEMMGAIKGQWGFWETTATEANQFKPSGYLDTGRMSQAVSMYGKADGTAGSTLTVNRGLQISGNNYEHINTNQGTISFWVKPSWDGNDGKDHYFFSHYLNGYGIQIRKITSNQISAYMQFDNSTVRAAPGFDVSGWTANSWHQITVRWDADTPVSSSNYIELYTDGAYRTAYTSSYVPISVSSTPMYIGSLYDGTLQAQSLIDDFAIFDRVLSSTEISSLYNSGTGNEAGYVADSSLKFYAKMDGTGTLNPVTYNGGVSSSKMTAKSTELTGGTNLLADGNMEVAGIVNWPAQGAAITVTKNTDNLLFDTQNLKVLKVSVGGQAAIQVITVSPNTNYYFSAWKKDATGNSAFGRLMVYDGTNSIGIVTVGNEMSSNWKKYDSSFKTASNTTVITVYLYPSGTNGESTYFDNVMLIPNLLDNGGMEGQYAVTGSALYTSTTAQTRFGSGPYVYTENGKFATGLIGLIATDGTNFGYITGSDANSVTVDFSGGSGVIPASTVLYVKSAIAPGWTVASLPSGDSVRRESSVIHSGTYSNKYIRTSVSGGTLGLTQQFSSGITIGNSYLVSVWVYLVSGNNPAIQVKNLAFSSQLAVVYPTLSAGVWTKISVIATATDGGIGVGLWFPYNSAGTGYFDDISITPLDNITTVFKYWAPISDSSSIGSSLSVQGSLTGVQSLASGVRNTGITLDGSTGFLRQQTIAVNLGNLTYATGNDSTTAQFEDDGMNFSTYQTTSGNAAYMIVVTNSDNTTTWGYLGTASGSANRDITIYTTKARATRGWNAVLPISGSKVPVGYEIRKTDYQIVSNLTLGAWVNLNNDTVSYLIVKRDLPGTVSGGDSSYALTYSGGKFSFSDRAGEAGANITMATDANWHYVVGTYDGTTTKIYLDGVKGTDANQTAMIDSMGPLVIGKDLAYTADSTRNLNGSIDEPFITADALSASQILDMYNKGLGALNHSTKTDQKLQGGSNTVQSVWGSSDGTTVYAGTDAALSIIKQGKIGNYTDSDSTITSLTTSTTPALLSNNSVVMDIVGSSLTTPTMIVGSSASGATALNTDRIAKTRNTTLPGFKYGSASVKLDNSLSSLDSVFSAPLSLSASTYTISAYVYKDGTSVSSSDAQLYANSMPLIPTYTDMGGGWWRLTGTFTGVTTSQNFGIQVKPSVTIYADAFQVENKPYLTTYTDGSLGSGYSWTGTSNNSSSNRTDGYLQYSTNMLNVNSGTINIWYKVDTWAANRYIFMHYNAGNRIYLRTNATSGKIDYWIGDTGMTTDAACTLSQWCHIVGNWNNGNYKIWINGVEKSGTYVNLTTLGSSFSLGIPIDATHFSPGGVFSDLRIYNQALTDSQVSDIYNSGLALHSLSTTDQKKYSTTGTWDSPIMNFNSNAAWGLSPNFLPSETLNGNTITYEVKTSPDGLSWGSYTSNTGADPNYSINALAQKYVQVRATLNSPSQLTTPILSGISIHYVQDTTAPTLNAQNTVMKTSTNGRTVSETGWSNGTSPYFQWDLAEDNIGGSGIKGYCLSLSQTLSDNPASQKGLLGTSPISTSGYSCQFIVGTNQIDFSDSSLKGNTWLSASNNPYYLNIKAIDNTGNVYPTSETFEFLYDDIPPTNVTSFSTPQNSFSNVTDIYFYWPAVGSSKATDSNSNILGYQYSINSESNWIGSANSSVLGVKYIPDGTTQPFYLTSEDASRIQKGNNTIYFKALDVAGNQSTISRTASVSYGGDAPNFADGSSVTITPEISNTNMYEVSWPSAIPSDGRTIKSYYYMVNTTPPNLFDTINSNSSIYIPTTNTSIPSGKLNGVIKGSNTIYVVAIDDQNNYSGANSISKSFTLNSTLPDPAINLRASDASIKSVSLWSVSLAWEEPIYKGTASLGYIVQRSENGTDWTKITETTGLAYVDTLPTSKKYYYRVGSIDNTDESRLSPNYTLPVSITPKGSYTVAAPLVNAPVTSNITTRRATVSWITGRSADSKIAYGVESGKYFEAETSISSQVISHTISLTNLLPSTTYYYKARWTDEDGNTGESVEQNFMTSPAPEVKDLQVKYVNTNSAQIQFTAKGASKVKVYYGKSTQFGFIQEIPTSTNESKYIVLLDNLDDGTKYYYRFNPYDNEDTEYEGTVLDISTLPKPKVSDVNLQQIKNSAETSILVNWVSNTDVSSIITYYPELNISQSRDSINLNLLSGKHTMTLSGLLPDKSYNLVVRGLDKLGNEARSDIVKFTTASDTRPPVITELQVESSQSDVVDTLTNKKTTQVIVSWKTDEPSTTQVEYGDNTGDVYNYKTPNDTNLKTDHVVIISNLEANKIYHLRAKSEDKAANESLSQDMVTITPNPTDNALDLIFKNFRNIFNF